MHQQQVAMLAQQQALYMAAAKAAGGGTPNGVNQQQAVANALNLASANWSNTGYQIPGMTNPVGGQADLQKLMQVRSPFYLFFISMTTIDQVLAKFSPILALDF